MISTEKYTTTTASTAMHPSHSFTRGKNIAMITAIACFALAVFCFVVHLLFFRYSFPPVNTDESSFFSPGRAFATGVGLASPIHQRFLPGASQYTYWMPPLYLVVLGTVFKIFGTTVMAGKLLSFLLSCVSAILLTTLATTRFEKLSAATLFLICPFIIITSAFIRVEALAILITVFAIMAVARQWPAYVLGIIAAIGLMTHPLMAACAAGLGLITLRRGVKPVLIFTLAFAIAFSPYLWYILQAPEFFTQQMQLQFLRKANASLFNLQPSYLAQSVPMVLLILFCIYRPGIRNDLRLFLTASSLLSLVVILRSNEFNYQVYLVPYTIAAVVLGMQARPSLLFRYGLPLLLFGFFGLMLVSKAAKYGFQDDGQYKELTAYLDTHPTWNQKKIYVAGGPDVASHLMMNGQTVERSVPIPMTKPADWFAGYNYVVEVVDNSFTEGSVQADSIAPWQAWPKTLYTTSKGLYTITFFDKNASPAP